MSYPRVSVVVPMYRVGGWDVVCDSLEGQTFREFELVVADAIEPRRAPLIAEKLSRYSFPIRHLGPSGGMALSDYSRAINDAVTHARGELVVIQSDYTWMPPGCLQAHYDAHMAAVSRGERACFMLDNHCTELPPLAEGLGAYGPDWEAKPYVTAEERVQLEREMSIAADRYELDLEGGKLDHLMWSIFKVPLTNAEVLALPIKRSHLKQGIALDPNWCSLKNEGIPTNAFLDVNGLDEDMDGSHLYQDQEFAYRAARAGYRWTTAPGGTAYMVNPRSVIYCKRVARPMRGDAGTDSNEARMKKKQATQEMVNPHRNLRAERAARLS